MFMNMDGFKKEGWNWKYPFGLKGSKNEPAVHINYDEAVLFCEWNKKEFLQKKNGIWLLIKKHVLYP